MTNIPEEYKKPGYGTIYSDAELKQAIAIKEIQSSTGGGSGDASAINQQTEIARLTSIDNKTTSNPATENTLSTLLKEGTDITGVSMPSGGASSRGWLSAIWKIIGDRLPTLGQALTTSSIPVVIPTSQITTLTPPTSVGINGSLPLPVGAATEITVSGLNAKIPNNLTVTNNKLVVDASSTTQPISVANLPLPSGASTEATLSTVNTKIPSNLTVTSGRLLVDTGNTSSTVTANLGTIAGVSTEATLFTLNTKVPTLGQALPANSTPVVLPVSQITTLTPPTSVGITGSLPLPTGASTESTVSGINTKVPTGLTVTSGRLLTDNSGVTQPISATSLPLAALASTSTLQATGNTSLNNIDGKLPSNLTVTSGRLLVDTGSSNSNQITGNVASGVTDVGNPIKIGGVYNTTYPTFTNGQRGDAQLTYRGELLSAQQDTVSAVTNVTVQDTASTVTTGANNQSIISGVATANSTNSISGTGNSSFAINVSGTFTGTLQFERSLDNGNTWTAIGAFAAGTSYTTTSTTTIGNFHGNSSSCTNIRVRAVSAFSGTAAIKIILGAGTGTITVGNGVRSFDKVSGAEHTIKAANTLPASTDTATVVTLREIPSLTITGNGSATDALVIPVTDCINYKSISLQLTGTWVGSVIFEWSNNNIDWISGGGSLSNLNNSTAPTSAASTNNIFNGNTQGRYFRARLQSYTNGTVNAVIILSSVSNQVPYPTTTITGTPTVSLFSNVVDTELPAPISLVDGLNLSNSPSIINAGYLYNPSTGWERARTSGSGRALVDGSAVTQPISATSLPLPINAATSTLQTSGNTFLSNIQSRLMPAGSSSNLYISLATAVSAVIKSAPGSIYSIINSLNTTNSIRYIQFFNSTSLPSNGATPMLPGYPIPPNNGLLLLGQDVLGGEGIYFSTGIAYGISTTPFIYTAAVATDVGLSIRYM